MYTFYAYTIYYLLFSTTTSETYKIIYTLGFVHTSNCEVDLVSRNRALAFLLFFIFRFFQRKLLLE